MEERCGDSTESVFSSPEREKSDESGRRQEENLMASSGSALKITEPEVRDQLVRHSASDVAGSFVRLNIRCLILFSGGRRKRSENRRVGSDTRGPQLDGRGS